MSEQSSAPASTRVAPVSRPVVYHATAKGQPPPPDTGTNPDTGEKIEILRVPGVTAFGGVFVVPENAWSVFERVIRTEVGAELVARRVGPTVPAAPTVESFLNERRLTETAINLICKTPFQAEGIRRGCLRDGFALIHPPGAGKTLSALAWLAADDDRQPVIVTTAKARWQYGSQIERFTSWHPIIVEGEKPDEFEWKDPDGKDYKGKLPHNRDFPIIVPWPLLPFWISRLRAFKPRRVVFDESHSPGAKSHSRWTPVVTRSGRMSYAQKKNVSSSAMQLSQMASVAARLATSATPVRDRQSDLWAQLDLIEPGAWGSYWVWAKAYCAAKEGAWGGMDDSGRSGSDELRERMDVVRHLVQLSEALKDLPPTRREVVRLYADQQNRAVAGFGREIRKAKKFGAQALLEARLAFAASRKREWIAERAAEMVASGQKVLIFTGRRADVSALAESIGKTLRKNLALKFENPEEWFGRFEMGPALLYATHGDHSDKQRSEFAVEYFERKTHACLVATVDSMGESIDLQTTDWTCWAMLPYTPGQLKQGEGRGRRLGQDRSMLVTYVVAMKTIDEHVAGILLDKLPAVSGTVGDQDAEELANVLDGIDEIEVMSRLHARVMQEIAEEEGTG